MTVKEVQNLKPGDKIRPRNSKIDWTVVRTFFSDRIQYKGYYVVAICYDYEEFNRYKNNTIGETIYGREYGSLPEYNKIFYYKYVRKAPKKVKVRRAP